MPESDDKRLELRLAILRSYDIMDTPPEAEFDDIARLAAFICQTPIATISLLDQNRQWFKAKVGLAHDSDPIDHSFCAHAIQDRKVMEVKDATIDPRFFNNPLVTAENGIRAYVVAPLVSPGEVPFGTLCAIDRVPRSFSTEQHEALAALSRQVVRAMEMRQIAQVLARTLEAKEKAEREVVRLQEIVPLCTWCHKIRDDQDYWNTVEAYITAETNARDLSRLLKKNAARV